MRHIKFGIEESWNARWDEFCLLGKPLYTYFRTLFCQELTQILFMKEEGVSKLPTSD